MKKLVLMCLIALFVFIPTKARALTLSQIITEARLRIKDTNSTRQRYTDSQLTNLANEAQRDANNATWVTISSYSFTLSSGVTYYAMPSDFIVSLRVTRDFKLLSQVTMNKEDADFGGSSWQNTGGTPTSYYVDPSSPNAMGFYPFPNSTTSTGTIRMQYVAMAADMSSTSTPFNGITATLPYDDLIIFYMAYRVYLIEGEMDKASIYRQEYENRLQVMRERVGQKPNYNPGFAGGPIK